MDFGAIFYPTFLVLLLFGLIILVGVVFSYWWLVMFDKKLRTCPNCQTRGAGNVVESELIASQSQMDFKSHRPVRVTVKTFEDHYKCERCGHTWIRTAQETTRTAVKS
jgi:hypothetical protein